MRTKWFNILVLLSLILGLLPVTAVQAASEPAPVTQEAPDIEIESALRNQLTADETTGYLIYFRDRPDLSPAYEMDWIQRGRFVANALHQTAVRSQAQVRAYLDAQGAKYKAFWIDNVIVVESSNMRTFNALSSFTEISALRTHREPVLHEPVEIDLPVDSPITLNAPAAIEPNLLHIDVDDVWSMGYLGEGLVVANIDTGVRYTHQALVNQYRGNQGGGTFDHNYNWWDPYDHDLAPNDTDSHGSHTMGTMIGDDGGANQIGMAPGATWMACQGFNPGATSAGLLECAQFLAAPWDLTGANANPDLRPHIINNSWGSCGNPTTYDPWYEGVVATWHAMGIYPVFSNGNVRTTPFCPQGLGQVGNPARYASVTGVGALGTSNATLASYSLWGPTDQEDTINPRGYPYLKPQVSAPGTNRSAYNTSDTAYGGMSGTSMAAPHVVGLIALMWEAGPCLVGDYASTETILEETTTATSWPGYPGHPSDGPGGVPNQATGWGEINALAAVQAAEGFCGDSVITGEVLDAATNATIAGVTILVTNEAGTAQRKTSSNAQGVYVLTVFSDTYTLEASHYGYQTTVIPDVVATTGATTTQHIAMTPAAFYEVSGQVTDATTGWPLYAQISIGGDPVDPAAPDNAVWTDPATGAYSVMLAEGVTYTFQVAAWVPGYTAATGIVGPLTTDVMADFPLQADLLVCAAPGYNLQTTDLLVNSFEGAAAGTFPADGWDQVDVSGTAGNWTAPTAGTSPAATPHSGSRLASFNSYSASSGSSTRLWRMPTGIDLTGITSPRVEFWFFHGDCGWNSGDNVQLQTSTDSGVTWVNVGMPVVQKNSGGWERYQFDLSAYAGNTDLRVGLLGISQFGCNMHVDDVRVFDGVCVAPTDGGLVVGNVYDANVSQPLTGAEVANDMGDTTTAAFTPDPAVDDAFYTLFSPSGAHDFTASNDGFLDDVATVNVVDGGTVAQDFYLDAGYLVVTPDGVEVTLEAGANSKQWLSLENQGALDAQYTLIEVSGGFIPNGPLAAMALPAPDSERRFELALGDDAPVQGIAAEPWTPDGTVALVVDDGSAEDAIGLTAGGQFIWLNRFTPDPSEFPFTLDQVWMLFRDSANLGEAIELVIWEDTDGDGNPGTGANFRSAEYVTVQANDNTTWSIYNLNSPVFFTGPGDVVIGAVNRDAAGPYPAAIDTTASQGRSWVGIYSGNPPEPPTLPPDADWGTIDSMGFPGNWMIRGSGVTGTGGGDAIPWLSEMPISGTVATGVTENVMLTFDAGVPEANQPGTYYGSLRVRTDTPYPDATVPVTMNVTAPASWGKLEGQVTSLGYCDLASNLFLPEEVEITIESATGAVWTLYNDAEGMYRLWLDPIYNPLTITAAAPEHATTVVTGVNVSSSATTTVDIGLRWLAPCVAAEPIPLEMTLELGYTATVPFSVTNTGASAASFDLSELDRGFTVARASSDHPNVSVVGDDISMSDTMDNGKTVLAGPAVGTRGSVLALPNPWVVIPSMPTAVSRPAGAVVDGKFYVLGGEPGYTGVQVYDPVAGTWSAGPAIPAGVSNACAAVIGTDIYIPGSGEGVAGAQLQVLHVASNTWETITSDPLPSARVAPACAAYEGKLYVFAGSDGGSYVNTAWVYDPAAAAGSRWSALANAPISAAYGGAITIGGNIFWAGMRDATVELADVYAYNVPGNSWVTYPALPAARGGAGLWAIGNLLYVGGGGWTTYSTAVYEYDTSLGTGGSWSVTNSLNQGRRTFAWASSPETGRLYAGAGWAGAYLANAEETAFPPILSAGIPWLLEDPQSGIVAADSTFLVDITFDAGATVTEVTQPGEYFGTLYVESDDSANNRIPVPVTMTVTAPATWGKLMGTVTSLGYCDADPAPVKGADVLIEASDGTTWTLMTDDMGMYAVWMDQMYSPVTVTVAAPEHEKGEAFGVAVSAGVTTTVDFDLRWLVPCVAADPPALHAMLELGTTATEALTLTNTGAVDSDWNIAEQNLGDPTGTLPGFTYYLNEDFEGAFPPPGWTRVMNSGCNWASSATTGYANNTGGAGLFADANSDDCGTGMDAELWTPSFDLSTASAPMLSFQSDFNDFGGSDDGYVDVSTDGGATWINLLHYDGVDVRGPRLVQLNLSAFAGQSNVIVRFHYVAPGWDWWWQVDDVQISDIDYVIWLGETPASGTLIADTGEQAVDVNFDATVVDQPGEYYANLWINSDDPFAPTIVPVTMTVTPPVTWARLDGTVYSTGYCDAEMNPVEGATVTIEDGVSVALTTGADGMYSYWLAPGTYTVTASAAEHLAVETVVTITTGVSQTQDFSLRWLVPCVTATPDAINDTLALGETSDHPLTIINDGAGDANFSFTEWYEGYVLPPVVVASEPAARLRLVTIGDNALAASPNATGEVGVAASAPIRPEGVYAITHSLSQNVLSGNSVSCNDGVAHTDNSYIRVFDLAAFGITEYFDVQQVEVGIEEAIAGSGSVQPGVINLYTLSGPLAWANMTLIGSATFDVADQALTVINVPIAGTAPARSVLVVEFFTPSGQAVGNSLFVGSNNLGQTAPTYLAAADCGIAEPMDTTAIGFPDMHLVMNVIGYTPENVELPWLIEDPLTGVALSDDTTVVTVTLDAGQVPLPGTYLATLKVETDDPVNPHYPVAVAMTVTLPLSYGKIEGTVYSTGYCDAEMNPVANADVVIEGSDGMTITVSTDVAGMYEVWRDEATGPYTVTAMAPDHWDGMATGVIVTGTETTAQNLELRWMKPCVGVAPAELTAEVALGMSVTTYITVANTGGYDLNWSLVEGEAGFTLLSPAAGPAILFMFDNIDAAGENAYRDALTAAGLSWDEWDLDLLSFPTASDLAAYDVLIWADEYTLTPGDAQCQLVADWLVSGDKSLFATSVDFLWDLQNGTVGAGEHNLYLLLNTQYVGDYAGTGISTLQGVAGDPIGDGLTLALAGNSDSNGDYADQMVGAPTGFLYGAGGTGSGYSALTHYEGPNYKTVWLGVNFHNGLTTQSERNQLMANIMDFLAGSDVPWLFEEPEDGMTAMDSTSMVTVTFDASVPEVTQPGEYYTTLTVESDEPQRGEIVLPVTMTVTAPATWGKLAGTVTGLGYCDANPAPIEGAVVYIESGSAMSWTLTTDVSGTYGVWFDEMYSPVTVTVSYEAGYEAQTFTGVTVISGTTTPLDANLRWLQPCVSTSDTAIEVTVPWGATDAVTLTLFNDGAVETPFSLVEQDLGVMIAGPQAVADIFGYAVADSNDGSGPAYDFVDISAFGTPVALGDDDFAGPLPIGFDFPFYGASAVAPNVYDQVFVNSNGFLSFVAGSTDLSNDVLPNVQTPNNIIALMWDDLVGGTAYYYTFDTCPYASGACMVVQYVGFTHVGGEAAGTWQAILFRNGNILVQFADAGTYAGAGSTTGIENEFGTDGITYAANAAVLENALAVCFAYPGNATDCVPFDAPWLDESVYFGSILADGSTPVTLFFDASVPEVTGPGDYMAELYLMSHDPYNWLQVIPVTMTVERPATWGKIDGTVIGWNHCDVAAFPLEGATVFIESVNGVDTWALTTDISGTYGLWLDAAHAPVTVTITHDGYITLVESVPFVAGDTPTEVAHELRMDAPCFVMDTYAIEFTVTKGHTHTEEMMMTNLGAGMLIINDVIGDGWMTPDMTSGMLDPDESHPMNIDFSAVGMSVGPHVGALVIMSNDPLMPQMTVPVTMTVLTPTLLVDVFATPPSVTHPGDLITYTIIVTNTADGPVDIDLMNMIPMNTTYVDGSVTGGLSYVQPTTGDDYVMWSGTLPQPQPGTFYYAMTFTFMVRVNDDVTGGTIDNTVEVETEDALFTDTVSVLVEFYRIYLPLTLRNAQ